MPPPLIFQLLNLPQSDSVGAILCYPLSPLQFIPSNIVLFSLIIFFYSLTGPMFPHLALRNMASEPSQQKHKVSEKHYFSAIFSYLVTLLPSPGYLCIESRIVSITPPSIGLYSYDCGKHPFYGHVTRVRITSF